MGLRASYKIWKKLLAQNLVDLCSQLKAHEIFKLNESLHFVKADTCRHDVARLIDMEDDADSFGVKQTVLYIYTRENPPVGRVRKWKVI